MTRKVQEFKSLNEFYKYINETPLNDVFRWETHRSTEGTYGFTSTHNFGEAVEMFKNGWDSKAQEIEKKLKIRIKEFETSTKIQSKFDVVGFQASVPRYLQGVPQNMINQKRIPQKQKIITINKMITYSGCVDSYKIMEYSLNALMLIKRIENQGYRVNLNIVFGTEESGEQIVCKIRIKNANERLNVSKVAFPLAHPSMLRRLLFRYMEVTPNVTNKGFASGYGAPLKTEKMQDILENELTIPPVFNKEDLEILLSSFNKNNLKNF